MTGLVRPRLLRPARRGMRLRARVRGGVRVLGFSIGIAGRAGRSLRLRLGDLIHPPTHYLVSFPKCGRTWLRMMIGSATARHLGLEPADPMDLESFHRLSPRFPRLRVTHDLEPHRLRPEEIVFRRGLYRKARILFLVRDPRDVLASQFHHQKHRRRFDPGQPSFETADEMVEAGRGGLRSLLRFYNVWAEGLPATAGAILLHYEDLKADPVGELRRAMSFLGLGDVAEESVRHGVAEGSLARMRAVERSGAAGHSRLQPADPANPDSFKVRKGAVGGHRDDFSPEAIEAMDAIIARCLCDAFARYK